MKIALVGLPAAGKKTLFSLLTGRDISAGLKPGEAVEGVAHIQDSRVDHLAGVCNPKKKTYAENNFVLCPDVLEGGRDWLDAARRCDLLSYVVRAFDADDVYHPAGSVDAARDLEQLRAELQLADMERIERRLVRLEKEKRAGQSAEQKLEESVLRKCMDTLEGDGRLRDVELDEREQGAIKSLELVTLLPELVIRNVAEDELSGAEGEGAAVSCLIEQEIMAIESDDERNEYLESLGISESGLERVNAAAYAAQGLMSFYTAGPDETRAWTIHQGSPAPVAGGKIHSDIERGFIRVEVIKFDDFVAAGSEKAAKEVGKMQLKGKDYVIEDGDICHFLFNV